MPDAPDSYFYSHIATLTPSTDINELAAKLNSPSTNFREGQIIYQNDFREGTKGIAPEVTPPDSEIYIDETDTSMTGMTLVMHTHTNAFSDCYIGKELPIYDTRYYTYSLLFTSLTNNIQFWVEFYITKDGYRYDPQIKYRPDTNELLILKDDNTWGTLPLETSIYRGSGMNMRWHLKVDIVTGYYVSLYINDQNIDLSSYAMRKNSISGAEYTVIYFSVRKVSGTSVDGYLNSFALSCSN